MLKKIFITISLLAALVSAAPTLSYAQTDKDLDYSGLVQCDGVTVDKSIEPGRQKKCDFQALINTISYIVKWLFGLSIPILVAMFAYSGILYMTPSPENRKQGSKMLWAGLKGLVIMLVAFFLVNTFLKWVISDTFTGTDTFLNLTK